MMVQVKKTLMEILATALVDINATGDKLIVIGTVTVGATTIWNKNFAFTIEGKDATSTITGNGGTSRLFTLNQPTTIDVTFKDLTFSNYNTTLAGGGVLLSNNAGAAQLLLIIVLLLVTL